MQVNDSTVASAVQGGTVLFTNGVVNTGNGSDTFNLTLTNNAFPSGTTFQLFKADGVTPLLDSNGDGIPDTGPMAASATQNIIVKATLPTGVHGGPYTVDLVGRSVLDSTKSDNGTDTLTSISTSTVDLTNNTVGGPGAGVGPEASAVATAVGPGSTARVTLVISNSSGTADTYPLTTIRIYDSTPAYTIFTSAACGTLATGLTGCTNTAAPAAGATGSIEWTLAGSLLPGATGTVTFQVTIQ